MRRGWPATSARSAATRQSSERAAAPAARARRSRATGSGTPRPARSCAGRTRGSSSSRSPGVSFRPESLDDPSFEPGPAARARPRARERARPERGRRSGTRSGRSSSAMCRARSRRALDGDEQAVSLWRVEGGLRVLIVPADAWVGRPAIDSAAVAYEFKLPDLGEGLTEGEVARWLVSEGDEVAEDQPLVEIQTDKTTVEIPSPAAGQGRADPRRGGQGRPGRHDPRRHRRGRRRAEHANAAAQTGHVPGPGPGTCSGGTCPRDAARSPARAGARRRPRDAAGHRARRDG